MTTQPTSVPATGPAPTTGSSPVEVAAPAGKPRIDPRYLAPMLITLILVGSNIVTNNLENPWWTGLAIVVAIVMEAVLSRATRGKMPHLASAYISGISVGILIRSTHWWPFALCAAISILSKYVLRYKGRHIWNPSNFGIVIMLLVAWDTVASLSVQWGNSLRLMLPIWLVGAMVVWRLRRVHISLAYAASFVFFALVRSQINGQPFETSVAPITGPMYQLFTLFMVTDPATTVKGRNGQILVVVLVALVEAILRLNGDLHAPYHALFLVGPTALVYQRWKMDREAGAAPQLATA